MRQPLKRAQLVGFVAVGVACAFIVVPFVNTLMGVLREAGDCLSCPAPPLADGMWFALVFALVGMIGSLMAVSKPTDSAVFMSAGGIGLLATGVVIIIGGMSSPHGEAVAWALAAVALGVAAVMTLRYRGAKGTKES